MLVAIENNKNILFLQNKIAYTQDEDAYKQLFYYFHPSLFRFAFSIIKKEDDAEDIVSDVMVKIWTMGSKLAFIDNLRVYLFKAVRNTAVTYLHTNNKSSTLELIDDNTQNFSSNNTEEKLLFSELNQKIENAINSLPPRCQLVFRLVKEEGLSYKEVSSVLEISQNTIETHMRLALKQIKKSLDEYLIRK